MIRAITEQVFRPIIEALPWVSNFAGVTITTTKTHRDQRTTTYPVCVVRPTSCPPSKEPIVGPDHKEMAIVWIQETSDLVSEVDPRFAKRAGRLYRQSFRVYGWLNGQALGEAGYDFAYTPEQDIIRVLGNIKLNGFQLQNIGQGDPLPINKMLTTNLGIAEKIYEQIFAPWSFGEEQKWGVKPYDYFAVDFELEYLVIEECIPAFVANAPLDCPPGYIPPECGTIVSDCEGNLIQVGEDGGACLTVNDLPDLGRNGVFDTANEGGNWVVEGVGLTASIFHAAGAASFVWGENMSIDANINTMNRNWIGGRNLVMTNGVFGVNNSLIFGSNHTLNFNTYNASGNANGNMYVGSGFSVEGRSTGTFMSGTDHTLTLKGGNNSGTMTIMGAQHAVLCESVVGNSTFYSAIVGGQQNTLQSVAGDASRSGLFAGANNTLTDMDHSAIIAGQNINPQQTRSHVVYVPSLNIWDKPPSYGDTPDLLAWDATQEGRVVLREAITIPNGVFSPSNFWQGDYDGGFVPTSGIWDLTTPPSDPSTLYQTGDFIVRGKQSFPVWAPATEASWQLLAMRKFEVAVENADASLTAGMNFENGNVSISDNGGTRVQFLTSGYQNASRISNSRRTAYLGMYGAGTGGADSAGQVLVNVDEVRFHQSAGGYYLGIDWAGDSGRALQDDTATQMLAADANGKMVWRDAATLGGGGGGNGIYGGSGTVPAQTVVSLGNSTSPIKFFQAGHSGGGADPTYQVTGNGVRMNYIMSMHNNLISGTNRQPTFILRASRGSEAAPAAIPASTRMAQWVFQAHDGSGYAQVGEISCFTASTFAAGVRTGRILMRLAKTDNSVVEVFEMTENLSMKLAQYGVGTFVDTPAYGLGVTAAGDVVEYDRAAAALNIYTTDGSINVVGDRVVDFATPNISNRLLIRNGNTYGGQFQDGAQNSLFTIYNDQSSKYETFHIVQANSNNNLTFGASVYNNVGMSIFTCRKATGTVQNPTTPGAGTNVLMIQATAYTGGGLSGFRGCARILMATGTGWTGESSRAGKITVETVSPNSTDYVQRLVFDGPGVQWPTLQTGSGSNLVVDGSGNMFVASGAQQQNIAPEDITETNTNFTLPAIVNPGEVHVVANPGAPGGNLAVSAAPGDTLAGGSTLIPDNQSALFIAINATTWYRIS